MTKKDLKKGKINSEDNDFGRDNKTDWDKEDDWISEYKKAFVSGFERILANKKLLFWGIFLPMSMSFSFQFNQHADSQNDLFTWNDVVKFDLRIGLILLGALFVGLIGWWLTAYIRVGVIKELDKLQNTKKAISLKFNSVWKSSDRSLAKKLLGIDLLMSTFYFFAIICLFGPVAWSSFYGSKEVAGVILFFSSIFYLFISVGLFMIKNTTINLLVFSKNRIWSTMEIAIFLLKMKVKETIRFILMLFVFNFFMDLFFLSLGFVFFVIFLTLIKSMGYTESIETVRQLIQLMIANQSLFLSFLIIGIVALVTALISRAFFALWFYDMWLWWLKRIGALWVIRPVKQGKEVKMEFLNKVASYKESTNIKEK